MIDKLEWDDKQEWWVEASDIHHTLTIGHQGKIVTIDRWDLAHEIDSYRFYPRYFVSSPEEKRLIILKALWEHGVNKRGEYQTVEGE